MYRKYKKMKDSGVEWIGEIPEHWEVRKIKFTDKVIMGQSPSSDDYNYDNGLPFLQGNADFKNIHPEPILFCDYAVKTAEENDVLLSVRAPVGAVNIADRKYGIGRGLTAIRPVKTISSLLYYFFLILHDELNRIATGSTYLAISADDVRNSYIPFISIQEQHTIAAFLDRETSSIDVIIDKITVQISKLRELRQTLISNAVTGKIDVRDSTGSAGGEMQA
jgi:type I restriction enzyme S subunit